MNKHYYARDDFPQVNNILPDELENIVVCADSEKYIKNIPDNCVDMIFTSPPYNFDMGYDEHEDDQDWNVYFDKLDRIFRECIRVLKYGGRLLINVQPLSSSYIPTHHIMSKMLMDLGLIFKAEIIWEKSYYGCPTCVWGSWKSPSNPYMKSSWEFLEVFCKGSLKHTGDKSNIDISADEFKKWVYSRWDVPPEKKMKKYGHPAMFPEELVVRALKLFSYKDDVIMDPFSGLGTTCVAAYNTRRKYIGIDISDKYCEGARKRLSNLPARLSG